MSYKTDMMMSKTPPAIYHGIRGKPFNNFIYNLLGLGKLKREYRKLLLEQGADLYAQVFTHVSADPTNNYEFFEFLGDVTLNKSIAWYLSRRFPQLNCNEGVRVLTRLKINLISKKSFADCARDLYFWDFISADEDVRSSRMTKTLEDVFEAFFGATEWLIDTHINQGAGYNTCYNIIEHLLNNKDISLKYNKLFDAKTRLKEIFDYHGDKLGKLHYKTDKRDRVHYVNAVQYFRGKETLLGQGYAYLKADAQQHAADASIKTLADKGIFRPLPEYYAKFCT
jgi:dsRNA-specific ribonuclease